jgi:hypothetical protein
VIAPMARALFVPDAPLQIGHDITTKEDRVRCEAHHELALTVAPDLAAAVCKMIGDAARDWLDPDLLRPCHSLHVDPSLPLLSWHAGPPRGGVSRARCAPQPSPLAQAMIAISQRCYSAEWLNTLAPVLWRCITSRESPMPFGNGQVDRAEILNLRALAAASGCWCDWSEAEGRPVDVPLGEWLAKFWNVKGGVKQQSSLDPDVVITIGEDGRIDMIEERLHLAPMAIKRGGAK